MDKRTGKDFSKLEDWLGVLIGTYLEHPSTALAKIISYQLNERA
jgi:hypothetical protein